jgi:hypothetical protein
LVTNLGRRGFMGETAGQTPSPSKSGKHTLRGAHRLTGRQIEAVYAVMRLLRDDRPTAGDDATVVCARCRRDRPQQGSIAYGSILLCNGCATDYELLRTAGEIDRIQEFVKG